MSEMHFLFMLNMLFTVSDRLLEFDPDQDYVYCQLHNYALVIL